MASVYRHSSRNGYVVQLCLPTGQRVVLWLGDVPKTSANHIARYVEQLAVATACNTTPHGEALRWAKCTDKRIKAKLIEWGLLPHMSLNTYTISTWTEHYCSIRSDVDETTRAKYRNAQRHLLAALPDQDLRSVTVAAADKFSRSLKGKDSTVGKIIKTVKQLFAAAVDERLIESNPFARLSASTSIDAARSAYVSTETAEAVLKQATNNDCRLAILFARWAGLRIPSELLELRWIDIDWDAEKILIHSPKGKAYAHRKQRTIPLFPRLKKALTEAQEQAKDGSIYLIERYRDPRPAARWFRKQLENSIASAKLTQWPKLWVNLRASCRTDLEESFPIHVCDEWLGHSDAVATKHYKRVTPEHFASAVRAVACAVKTSHQ